MKPFQGVISITDGKIDFTEPSSGFVRIISNRKNFHFGGCCALPGLVDSHGHISALGEKLNSLSLDNAGSPEECIDKALSYNKLRSGWLLGYGWNQEGWEIKKFPDKNILDRCLSDTPVVFIRQDGHSAWVNSAALSIARIGRNASSPKSGIIEKDKSGNPTGILVDDAMELVRQHIPGLSAKDISENIISGLNICVENGLTEIHDMDVEPGQIAIFDELSASNLLPLKVHSYIKGQQNEYLHSKVEHFDNNFFGICGIKLYADGALGSRSAALLEPYSDSPDTKGLLMLSALELRNKSLNALERGFQVAVHAIGDAANRMCLDVFSDLRKIFKDAVLRIEHAQIVHPKDQMRFGDLNVIASVQPIHCLSDAAMAQQRLGLERCSYSYPWKSLIDSETVVCCGSDFPIESQNPFWGIEALTHRIPFKQENPWFPAECLTFEDALQVYTQTPHIASGIKNNRGAFEKGYDADFAIIKENFLGTNPDEIVKNRIEAVFVDGKMKYSKNRF